MGYWVYCGRTTRGQAGLTDSSPARHVSQGDQRQLSTADGTNYLFSSPYKREEGTGSGGKGIQNNDCFSKGEDLPDGREKRTNYLLGMATTDPHHHPKGTLLKRIFKAVTHP